MQWKHCYAVLEILSNIIMVEILLLCKIIVVEILLHCIGIFFFTLEWKNSFMLSQETLLHCTAAAEKLLQRTTKIQCNNINQHVADFIFLHCISVMETWLQILLHVTIVVEILLHCITAVKTFGYTLF